MDGLFKKDFSSLNRRRKQKSGAISGGFRLHNSLEESPNSVASQSNLHDKPKTSKFLQKLEAFRAHKTAKKPESSHIQEVKDVSKTEIKLSSNIFETGPKLLKEDPVAFLMLKSLEANGRRIVGDVNRPLMLNILPQDEYVYFTIGDQIIEKIVLKRKQHISQILLSDVGRSLLIVLGVDRGYVYVNYLSLDTDLIERFRNNPNLWPVDVKKRYKNADLLEQIRNINQKVEAAKKSRESGIGSTITTTEPPNHSKTVVDEFTLLNMARRAPTLIGTPSTYDTKNSSVPVENSTPVRSERITRQTTFSPTKPLSELISLDMNTRTRSKTSKSQPEETPTEKPEPFDPPLSYKFDDGKLFVVTYSDFKTLYNNDWINDTVIDFFIKYDIEEATLEERFNENDIYAFNSFFFPKLMSGEQTSTEPVNYYQNVRKWLQKVDLMQFSYVLIPINEHSHWYCCIIKGLPTVLEYFKLHPREISETDPEYKEENNHISSRTENSEPKIDQQIVEEKSESQKVENEEPTKTEVQVAKCDDKNVSSKDKAEQIYNEKYKSNANVEEHENIDYAHSAKIADIANTGSFYEEPTQDENNTDFKKPNAPKVEVFIFDSLSLNHSSIKNPLKQFIIDYCIDKHKVSIPKENIRMINAKVPKQNNFNDCGIHVIFNVRKWLSDHNECERLWRSGRSSTINFQSRQFFKASERNTMRKVLRDTLLKLQRSPRNVINKLTSTSDIDDDIEIIEMTDDNSGFQEETNSVHNRVEDVETQSRNRESLVEVIYNRSLRSGLNGKIFTNLTVRILNQIFDGKEPILQQLLSKTADFAGTIDRLNPDNDRYISEVDKFLAIVEQERSANAIRENKSKEVGEIRPKDEKFVIQDKEYVERNVGDSIKQKHNNDEDVDEEDDLNKSVGSLGISENISPQALSPGKAYRSFPNKRRRLGKR